MFSIKEKDKFNYIIYKDIEMIILTVKFENNHSL